MGMYSMFNEARKFNQDISAWDTSMVNDMSFMFWKAKKFNQDIGSWDTRRVTGMSDMFKHAHRFNQDLTGWQVSQITDKSNCSQFCAWNATTSITHACRINAPAAAMDQKVRANIERCRQASADPADGSVCCYSYPWAGASLVPLSQSSGYYCIRQNKALISTIIPSTAGQSSSSPFLSLPATGIQPACPTLSRPSGRCDSISRH